MMQWLLVLLIAILLVLLIWTSTRARRRIAEKDTELSTALEQVEELARRDPLTRLLNRRAFIELMEYESQRQWRNQQPISFIIADTDHFKRLNDNYGHACGDSVLSEIAQALTRSLRGQDTVCRWGGEEFLVMLPGTGLADAVTLAERLREAIAGLRLQCEGRELAVTMTFGVAECPVHDETTAAISRADKVLYKGKKAGRNRVVAADPPQ